MAGKGIGVHSSRPMPLGMGYWFPAMQWPGGTVRESMYAKFPGHCIAGNPRWTAHRKSKTKKTWSSFGSFPGLHYLRPHHEDNELRHIDHRMALPYGVGYNCLYTNDIASKRRGSPIRGLSRLLLVLAHPARRGRFDFNLTTCNYITG